MENIEKRSNKTMQFVFVLIYLILTIAGLVLIKKGANPGSLAIENGNLNFGINLISLLGFICYICSFLLYTRIVVMFDLSYIVPLTTGIVQILTLISSYVIFKEEISVKAIIGASIIIIGIIIMNWKS